MRRVPLIMTILIGVALMGGCFRSPAGPSPRPALTGDAAVQEDRRLEAELEKITGVRSATVTHTTGGPNVSNSLWVNLDSPAAPDQALDALSDAALRTLWNTRQFVPAVVNLAVADGGTGLANHDLRRLGFGDRAAAYGDELRRRYGAPSFEAGPPAS